MKTNNETGGKAECQVHVDCTETEYRNEWERIADHHYLECPTAIAADAKRLSTLCLCAQIGAADKAARAEADECLRCHHLPALCKCGARAQF